MLRAPFEIGCPLRPSPRPPRRSCPPGRPASLPTGSAPSAHRSGRPSTRACAPHDLCERPCLVTGEHLLAGPLLCVLRDRGILGRPKKICSCLMLSRTVVQPVDAHVDRRDAERDQHGACDEAADLEIFLPVIALPPDGTLCCSTEVRVSASLPPSGDARRSLALKPQQALWTTTERLSHQVLRRCVDLRPSNAHTCIQRDAAVAQPQHGIEIELRDGGELFAEPRRAAARALESRAVRRRRATDSRPPARPPFPVVTSSSASTSVSGAIRNAASPISSAKTPPGPNATSGPKTGS